MRGGDEAGREGEREGRMRMRKMEGGGVGRTHLEALPRQAPPQEIHEHVS